MPLPTRDTFRRALLMCAAGGGLLCGHAKAIAAEYCVTCAEPAAMYACVVAGTPAEAPANASHKLTCIQELAKAGGHGTCSVPSSAPSPCPGVLRIVTAPADQPDMAADPATGEASDGAAPAPEEATEAPKEQKVPRTVEELAKQTVQNSKEGLQKAGEAVSDTAEKAGDQVGKAGSAVGNAAKKTWDCIKSLFSDC